MELHFDKWEDFPVVTSSGWPLMRDNWQYIQRRNCMANTAERQVQVTVCDWDSLALCSPVLEAWTRWEPEIKMQGTRALSTFSNDKNAITQLTDYMQGRRIKVTNEELYELLSLADMLQVDDVFNYCKHRITCLELNKDNYHKILHTCTMYSFEHEEMDQFIRGKLTELCKESGILTICPDSVYLLLTDEELSYWPMDDRFDFITNWCNAYDGRAVYFEKLFDHLDFNRMDKDIIEEVVKNENLVRLSPNCLNKVNVHLRYRQDTPVPFVFTLNDTRTGSNVTGFNLEDKQLYKFKFPEQIISNANVTSLRDSGKTISFEHSHRYMYEYDINTNVCKKKKLLFSKGKCPDNITHIVDANDRLIFICNPYKTTFWNINRTWRGVKRGSVLYQQVNDLEMEPLLSLTFEVSCACFSHSSIIMSTTTYSKRSKLFCFNLRTNHFTEMDLEIARNHGTQPLIQCLLPVHEKLLLTYEGTFVLLSLNDEKGTCGIEDRHWSNISSVTDGNPRYVFFSDFIIELSSKSIRLCYSSKDEIDIRNWFSFELKRLNFHSSRPVSYDYLSRTKPLCHIMCPHCDPDAWKKEEELRLQESLKSTFAYDSDDYDRDYDDDFNDYGYNDGYSAYDGYSDDLWNQRELIWDGSADEFVEAWW